MRQRISRNARTLISRLLKVVEFWDWRQTSIYMGCQHDFWCPFNPKIIRLEIKIFMCFCSKTYVVLTLRQKMTVRPIWFFRILACPGDLQQPNSLNWAEKIMFKVGLTHEICKKSSCEVQKWVKFRRFLWNNAKFKHLYALKPI